MKLKKSLLAVAITSITALTLNGCGTDKQDGGNGSSNADISSGIAVDGPIVRAQVFYDLNGNKKKESFEPGALTDNAGHYNLVPAMGDNRAVNYCAGSSARPEFCLTLTTSQQQALTDDTKIIVTGGYDLYTGEPFEGSMSFPAKSSNGESQFIAITPMTSMIEGISDIEDFLEYLNSLEGISDLSPISLLTVNFLEDESKFNKNAFAISYQMHKYVTVISDWVKDQPGYFEIEDGDEIQSDISVLIYRQFAELNKSTDAGYRLAWGKIRQDIDDLYVDANLAQPIEPNAENVDILVNRLTAVNSATTAAFGNNPSLGSNLTFDNVKGRTRGVEVVVLKIIRDDSGNENAHLGALEALSDTSSNDAYFTNLEGDTEEGREGNINFTKLVETSGDKSAFEAAAQAAKDTSGSNLASDLAGKTLIFEDDNSDPDLDAKAAIFFTGEEGATRGDIHLCLKYQEVGEEDQALPGDYISGSWETLASLNNTVMLRLNYLGGRSAVLKKIGETGNENEAEYRFDFNGEASNFTGENELDAITEDTTVISSQAACTTWVNENTATEEEEPNSVLLPLN